MASAADLALAHQSQGESVKSLLGASLAGQKNYAEAEPLLLTVLRGWGCVKTEMMPELVSPRPRMD
jgi:hypothetical protein